MEEIILERLPVIALRGLTVFPGAVLHFDVGREKSVRALDRAMNTNQRVFLVTQNDITTDDPDFDALCPVGTVAKVKQVLRLPGESIRVLIQGETRGRVNTVIKLNPYLCARIEHIPEQTHGPVTARTEAEIRMAYQQFETFMELSQKMLGDDMLKLLSSHDPGVIADIMAQDATFDYRKKTQVLCQLDPNRRLHLCNVLLHKELEVLRMEAELQEKVQSSVNKGQREYYLREQLKVIHSELGDDDEEEFDAYESRIKALKLPQESESKLLKELERLRKQPFGSSEAAVIRTYLDTVLELPWNTRTKERIDLTAARKILDEDHFGLEKVKERILEMLAVRKLAPDMKGQILCLVGPPGVGKTSVSMSIARCLNRKLARISLGGVHDEAEIRGHRKTYVGAMPGRILAAVAQAKSSNPLLLLDEIDKLGSDYRGDPSAALLEVLDSEQNATFRDNYLEIPFDLSQCMFITTANTTDTIPRALLDRMEVIELSSYTDEEKLMIAKQHLLPKELARHGLKKSQVRVGDAAIREVIACYTRESGVRNLERELAGMCRKAAMLLTAEEAPKRVTVTTANLEQFLGVRKILPDKLPEKDPVGLVNGLAWTAAGGEMLEVECNVMEGSGKLELTGNLGDVMKESVHAAVSYIRTRTREFGIADDFYKTKDIHVHFPEGAIPKDGPSAGVTVCTAIVSALTGAPVRRDIAMTGEISIRGRVLPIGGLKEKTMAALRRGIKTVIIPQDNEKDLEEIDQTVRRALQFITVEHADAVIDAAVLLNAPACAGQPRTEMDKLPLPAKTVPPKVRKPDIRQ
ncbi:MAG: endopeptidase La [Candidatus Faecousia sp.]|nr:endopeptidase La [Candidatus Faecousia sp.]